MTYFVYHKGDGSKGSNEVWSWLKWYIENKISPDVKTLYIFGYIAQAKIKIIPLCDIVRPCIIRWKLKREVSYYTLPEVVHLIKTSSQIKDNFDVVEVKTKQITDFKGWWPTNYNKTVLTNDSYEKAVLKDKKRAIDIAKYHQLCSFLKSLKKLIVQQ